MKEYEFQNELSDKAFNIYSNSSFTFYKDKETFFVGYNSTDTPFELGNIKDVEEFLIGFADDDD